MWRIRCWGSARAASPKPNIAVTRGNLSDENCACRRQNLRFLVSSTLVGQFLRHVFAPYSSKVKSSQNLRVLRTNPASCLPMNNRRVGDSPPEMYARRINMLRSPLFRSFPMCSRSRWTQTFLSRGAR
jgi:hypothetical protein